jgi:hypothetical protein
VATCDECVDGGTAVAEGGGEKWGCGHIMCYCFPCIYSFLRKV